MYFLKGILPWQNLKAVNKKDKYEKIMEKKLCTPIDTLCKGFPIEFGQYLNYCKNLKYDEKPDYAYLKKSFKDLFQKNNFELDYNFDWTAILKEKEKKEQEKTKV